MRSKHTGRIVSGIIAASMAFQLAAVIPAAAEEYTNSVDISLFDQEGVYDEASGVETVTIADKTWSKLDLRPYTQIGREKTLKVTVSYKETMSPGANGRINIGFYDEDEAEYAQLSGQYTQGSAVVYGVLGSSYDKRVYVNKSGGRNNGNFAINTEEQVTLVFDLENKKVSGNIGAHTIAETAVTDFDSVDTMALYNWSDSQSTYKISDMKITTVTSRDVYNSISFIVGEKEKKDSVKLGEHVTDDMFPDTKINGQSFDGWYIGEDDTVLYSNEQVKAMEITDPVTFTAKYSEDTSYVQTIKSAVFEEPAVNVIVKPETEDMFVYTVKVTSDIDKDITDDCTFTDWKIVGAEADDGHITFTGDGKTADLTVSSGVSDYYGYISVTVTYDPPNKTSDNQIVKTVVQMPYAILVSAAEEKNIIPEAGYPAEMRAYPDSLVGYQATENTQTGKDIVLNNWSIYGSNPTRSLTLVNTGDGDKALRFSNKGGQTTGTGSSTVGVYQWQEQTKPYVIDTVIKMPANSSIGLYDNTPNNSNVGTDWAVKMNSTSMSAGSETISGVSAQTYYRLVVVVDPVNMNYYVKVYSTDGELVGETGYMECKNNGKYLCLFNAWPIDVKSFRAYSTEASTAVITGDNAVDIPEDGEEDVTVAYSVVFKDDNGNNMYAEPVWSFAEDYANVLIDEKTGELTVRSGAPDTIIITATDGTVTGRYEVSLSIPMKYLVTFKNGEEKIGEETVKEGQTVKTVPNIPVIEGKEGKWMVGEEEFDPQAPITGTTVVTLVYTNVHKITFKNGDDIIGEETVKEGETVTSVPNIPVIEGKEGKWMVGEEEFDPEKPITADTEVSLIYTNLYKVTFKNGDEIIGDETVKEGETVTSVPNIPVIEGKEGKWMIGEEEFDPEKPVTAETVVDLVYTDIVQPEFAVNIGTVSYTAGGVQIWAEVTGTGERVYEVYTAEYSDGRLTGVHKDNITVTESGRYKVDYQFKDINDKNNKVIIMDTANNFAPVTSAAIIKSASAGE